LRFAVGIFDTWAGVQASVHDLTSAGMAESRFNYLGLNRVLSPPSAPPEPNLSLCDLPFPGNADPASASDGPLVAILLGRLGRDARTLASALGHWLIPRHAAQLQDAVAAGKIVLWVQLLDNDEERRACRSLLARSSNSVGVHDIVG
jgi:hypothetical protein